MRSSFLINPEYADMSDGQLIAVATQQDDIRITGIHSHARGQLLGAMNGLLSVETPNNKWVVPATHAVWIPPDMPHAFRSYGPFEGWSLYVAPSACREIPPQPFIISTVGLLREAILRALTWGTSPLDAAQQRIAEVILDEVQRLPHEALGLSLPKDIRLLKITQALANDPADQRTLAEWADWVGIAPRSMTRRFMIETGFTFTEWRQRIRLLKALEKLALGQSVTTISLELGYDNISAFIALFKRTFGITPGRYSA
ncbi:AraC-like DNA-binding protein [Providencia alcalifaciens]|nr:AraC-like DNA-binding protein [Providencia alcalifaciens]